MPQKGVSNNPNGKPKGTQNRLTKERRKALAEALDGHIDRIPEYIDNLDTSKEKLEALARFIPYIVPKAAPESARSDEPIDWDLNFGD